MTKKILIIFSLLFLTLASAYTTLWFYYASVIDREVAKFMATQEQNNIIFDGAMSNAHGFPGIYKIVYAGKILTPHGKLSTPRLEISGIPLEGQDITLLAPLGLTVQNRALPEYLKELESALLVFTIPQNFPPAFTQPHVNAWQASGNATLKIPSFTLQWRDASIYAEAELRLNKDLQPEGEAKLGVTNHSFFLDLFADEYRLPKTQKLMALTFLNALNKDNGAVIIPVKLQQNTLYLGVIRVGALPFIFWPTPSRLPDPVHRGNRLVPHQ